MYKSNFLFVLILVTPLNDVILAHDVVDRTGRQKVDRVAFIKQSLEDI